jgi:hypothetical protein
MGSVAIGLGGSRESILSGVGNGETKARPHIPRVNQKRLRRIDRR